MRNTARRISRLAPRWAPRWALWTCASLGAAAVVKQLSGQQMPLPQVYFLRLLQVMRRLRSGWRLDGGREEALATYVATHARRGDVADVIRVIDDFCYRHSFMMNVGDEKGEILDAAIRRARPQRLLELGTYCGYSALRMVQVMPPDARLYSIELNPTNAEIARRIWDHADVGDRVTVVVGRLCDDESTLHRLRTEYGFAGGSLDFVFLDHDKAAYLPDLERILTQRWLHSGSVVVADNVKFPGAPQYRAYMRERQGQNWRTTEHKTHLEYQSWIKDLVLESEYLGG
jgi:catechol O-methyltransferase